MVLTIARRILRAYRRALFADGLYRRRLDKVAQAELERVVEGPQRLRHEVPLLQQPIGGLGDPALTRIRCQSYSPR